MLKPFRAGDWIEEMKEFDFDLLDKRSYGLKRSYDLCPNYSDETTARIIEKHLALLCDPAMPARLCQRQSLLSVTTLQGKTSLNSIAEHELYQSNRFMD